MKGFRHFIGSKPFFAKVAQLLFINRAGGDKIGVGNLSPSFVIDPFYPRFRNFGV